MLPEASGENQISFYLNFPISFPPVCHITDINQKEDDYLER